MRDHGIVQLGRRQARDGWSGRGRDDAVDEGVMDRKGCQDVSGFLGDVELC